MRDDRLPWRDCHRERVREGRAGAQRDERVHVCVTVPQRGPRAAVETAPRNEEHRHGQGELHPVHARKLRVRHAEHDQRRTAGHGHDEEALECGVLALLDCVLRMVDVRLRCERLPRPGLDDLVADVPHRIGDARQLHERGIEPHAGASGRVVHRRRIHPGQPGQRALDDPCAGGARHPCHGQADARERLGWCPRPRRRHPRHLSILSTHCSLVLSLNHPCGAGLQPCTSARASRPENACST
jgi:hypothetical protein